MRLANTWDWGHPSALPITIISVVVIGLSVVLVFGIPAVDDLRTRRRQRRFDGASNASELYEKNTGVQTTTSNPSDSLTAALQQLHCASAQLAAATAALQTKADPVSPRSTIDAVRPAETPSAARDRNSGALSADTTAEFAEQMTKLSI